MAHIVDDRCIGCLHKTCIEHCPVNCFHLGANMVVIDPSECIDCGLCVEVCPTKAIHDVGEERADGRNEYWADFNAHFAGDWPRVSDIAEELPKDLSQFKVFPIDKEKALSAAVFDPTVFSPTVFTPPA